MPKTPALPPHVSQHPTVAPVAQKLADLRERLRVIDARRDEITAELNYRQADGTAQRPSGRLQNWLDTLEVQRASLRAAVKQREESGADTAPVLRQLKDLDTEHARVAAELKAAFAREHAPGARERQVDAYLSQGRVETATDAPLRDEFTRLSMEAEIVMRAMPKVEAEIASKSAAVFPEYCAAKRPEFVAAVKQLATALIQAAKANDQIGDVLAQLDAAGVVSAAYLRNVQFHSVGSARYPQDHVALFLRECIEAGLLTGNEKDVKEFLSSFKS
jgi:hypothetical protein